MIENREQFDALPKGSLVRDADGILVSPHGYEGSADYYQGHSGNPDWVEFPAVRLVPEPEPLDIDQIATRYLVTNFGCGCVDCYETARGQVVEVLTAAGFTITHPRTEQGGWEPPFWNGNYDDQYVRGCSNCDGGGCGDCVIA